MNAMSTVHPAPHREGLTRADLAQLPDDGLRYEIIDGELFVTPAPRPRHQQIVTSLILLLAAARPSGIDVLTSPLAVGLARDTEVQPDLVVAHRTDFTDTDLPVAPLLVVEVLSPSTRHIDLGVKRVRYERAGIASYWIVNPEGPSLTVLELEAGRYAERTTVGPGAVWTASLPFRVTIRPGAFLD